MKFKFFTVEDAKNLEAESQFEVELRYISKLIKDQVKRGSYEVQLPHNKYSSDAFEQFRKAGFQIDESSPCGILISWQRAVDEENRSAYVTAAYVLKTETDDVIADLLREIESGIRVCIDQNPGTGSFARKGRLSRPVREIIENNGFKVTHYDSTVNRDEFDLIEWPVG